jgi:hypothetical protein
MNFTFDATQLIKTLNSILPESQTPADEANKGNILREAIRTNADKSAEENNGDKDNENNEGDLVDNSGNNMLDTMKDSVTDFITSMFIP